MPSDPATLLRALWDMHTRASRSQFYDEETKVAADYARRGLGQSVGAITAQWDVQIKHLEGVVCATLDDFEKRAARDAAAQEYLGGTASPAVAAMIEAEATAIRLYELPGGTYRGPQLAALRRMAVDGQARRAQELVQLKLRTDAKLRVMAESILAASPPPTLQSPTAPISPAQGAWWKRFGKWAVPIIVGWLAKIFVGSPRVQAVIDAVLRRLGLKQ